MIRTKQDLETYLLSGGRILLTMHALSGVGHSWATLDDAGQAIAVELGDEALQVGAIQPCDDGGLFDDAPAQLYHAPSSEHAALLWRRRSRPAATETASTFPLAAHELPA